MAKFTSGCALVISMIALFFAWQAFHQLDQRADDALARRERILVQKMAPRVREICEDFGVDFPSTSPETLEELLRPIVKLVEDLQSTDGIVEGVSEP